MVSPERQALCVAACEGVPDSYLSRGPKGLWEWFQKQRDAQNLDAWMPLSDLRRYLPHDRSYRTVWAWHKLGISNRRGQVVRLAVTSLDGVQGTTLREYHLMNLRCDPASIATLASPRPGLPGLYLALCHRCERRQEFEADPRRIDPKNLLRAGGWSLRGDGWACEECKDGPSRQ